MKTYLEILPDYYTKEFTKNEFSKVLTTLAKRKKHQRLANGHKGLRNAGYFGKIWQIARSFFGLRCQTNPTDVNYEMLRFIHYGGCQKYLTSNKILELVSKVKEREKHRPKQVKLTLKQSQHSFKRKKTQRNIIKFYEAHRKELQPYFWNRFFYHATHEMSTFKFGDTYLDLAESALQREDFQKAFNYCYRAYKFGRRDKRFRKEIGEVLLKVTNHPKWLCADRRKAEKLLLSYASKAGNDEEELSFFQAAKRVNPALKFDKTFSDTTHLKLAKKALKQNQYDEALYHYKMVRKNRTDFSEEFMGWALKIGKKQLKLNMHQGAAVAFEAYFKEINSSYSPPLINSSSKSRLLKILTHIAEHFRDSAKEPVSTFSTKERRRHIRRHEGSIKHAILFYKLASKVDPTCGEYYFQKACLEDYISADSFESYQKAYSCNPDEGYYIWGLARAYSFADDKRNYEKMRDLFLRKGNLASGPIPDWFAADNRFVCDEQALIKRG